jgi:hypothetical protein
LTCLALQSRVIHGDSGPLKAVGVDLVAAAVEAVTVGVAGADEDRSDAGGARELGVRGEAAGA